MQITYRELAYRIQQMSENQQDSAVTVQIGDDFLLLGSVEYAETWDILEKDQPYLI